MFPKANESYGVDDGNSKKVEAFVEAGVELRELDGLQH